MKKILILIGLVAVLMLFSSGILTTAYVRPKTMTECNAMRTSKISEGYSCTSCTRRHVYNFEDFDRYESRCTKASDPKPEPAPSESYLYFACQDGTCCKMLDDFSSGQISCCVGHGQTGSGYRTRSKCESYQGSAPDRCGNGKVERGENCKNCPEEFTSWGSVCGIGVECVEYLPNDFKCIDEEYYQMKVNGKCVDSTRKYLYVDDCTAQEGRQCYWQGFCEEDKPTTTNPGTTSSGDGVKDVVTVAGIFLLAIVAIKKVL